MNETVEIEIPVDVCAETNQAMLVDNGHWQTWVPKSQVIDQRERDDGTIQTIFLPEWLALKKGLI